MSNFIEYYQYREETDTSIELLNFAQEVEVLLEWKKSHPGKDVPKKKRSEIVKKARSGENVFGGGFDKVAKKASEEYGSEEAGKRVAAAVMWKKAKGKHMTKEDVDDLLWILEDDVEKLLEHLHLVLEKNWIKGAVNPKHKGFCTPMTKKTCTPRRKALAMRFKKGDIHKDNLEKNESVVQYSELQQAIQTAINFVYELAPLGQQSGSAPITNQILQHLSQADRLTSQLKKFS